MDKRIRPASEQDGGSGGGVYTPPPLGTLRRKGGD